MKNKYRHNYIKNKYIYKLNIKSTIKNNIYINIYYHKAKMYYRQFKILINVRTNEFHKFILF